MKQNWKENVSIFLGCQLLSIFGSSLVQYAITWHVTLTTKSGVYAALVIICGFVPTFFLSPFAGVWADRYNRKTLIMLADAGIALCTLALAVTFLLGYDMIWLLLVAAGVRALGSAVQNPCVGAMLPDLVPQEQLTRVNGINSSLQSLIMLVSPMLSGVLLSFSKVENVFFIDVITAALAILIMLLFLKVPQKPEVERDALSTGSDYLSELKAGFAYIGSHAYLRNFFIFCGIFMFMMAPAAFLTPLQTARTFGEDVWRLTAIELLFASGMMLGGILIASWGGFKNRVHTMALGCVGIALTTLAMGLPRYFWLYLVFMGICGITVPVFNTPAIVLLQEQTAPEYIGRVFGIMSMVSSSIMPLGMLVFGPLADIVRIEWLLLGTGAFMLVVTAALLNNKPLLEAGAKPAPD